MSQSYNPFYNIENPQLMGYDVCVEQLYAWAGAEQCDYHPRKSDNRGNGAGTAAFR